MNNVLNRLEKQSWSEMEQVYHSAALICVSELQIWFKFLKAGIRKDSDCTELRSTDEQQQVSVLLQDSSLEIPTNYLANDYMDRSSSTEVKSKIGHESCIELQSAMILFLSFAICKLLQLWVGHSHYTCNGIEVWATNCRCILNSHFLWKKKLHTDQYRVIPSGQASL